MEPRFLRNVPALTRGECDLLAQKTVCVAGCGGIGGYALELLARCGVGRITAVDGDAFAETNLNRQLLSAPSLLGQNKAAAARNRLACISPDTVCNPVETFLTAENAPSILSGCDVAIDALDNIPARRILAEACDALGVPLVHGAVSGWNAQIAVIPPGSGGMERLYPPGRNAPERSPATLSFAPSLCASVQAAEAVKLLCGRESNLAGKLLLINLNEQTYHIVAI